MQELQANTLFKEEFLGSPETKEETKTNILVEFETSEGYSYRKHFNVFTAHLLVKLTQNLTLKFFYFDSYYQYVISAFNKKL